MLRNCKVARVLPRIADCAKNDRNAILRARYLKILLSVGSSYLFGITSVTTISSFILGVVNMHF